MKEAEERMKERKKSRQTHTFRKREKGVQGKRENRTNNKERVEKKSVGKERKAETGTEIKK